MDWKYYNQGMLPTTAPHEVPDLTPIKDGSIWKPERGGKPLLARWTTDYDCGYETGWWYCVKDTPFELQELNSKTRYKINKAYKKFEAREIDPVEYAEDIIRVQTAAWSIYPEAYRPKSDADAVRRNVEKWRTQYRSFAAFSLEDGQMAGYALMTEYDTWVDFTVLKADPDYERKGVNVALVAKLCEFYSDRIKNEGYYISEGERNIIHETAFQDFLAEKYDFRRAYCKLNIAYRKPIGLAVKILYPFRGIVSKMKNHSLMKKIDAILLMESICREQR